MNIKILTLFPEYFNSVLKTSVLHRAIENKLVQIEIINIRDFATDKHAITDDRPFGGGPGMVLKVEPIHEALKSLGYDIDQRPSNYHKVFLTSAKGQRFTQEMARAFSDLEEIVLICGHYEGVDERVSELLVDGEIRIGEYVLTGGEPAVAVIVDAITRLIPGAIGNTESIEDESHGKAGKLGYPCYTRPANYLGYKVPEVLLSGNHEEIEKWRKGQQRYEKESSGNKK